MIRRSSCSSVSTYLPSTTFYNHFRRRLKNGYISRNMAPFVAAVHEDVEGVCNHMPFLVAHSCGCDQSVITRRHLCLHFGICPSSVSRFIHVGMCALFHVLKKDPLVTIAFPIIEDLETYKRAISIRYPPLLDGMVGILDGLKLRVHSPTEVFMQNALYNGRKSDTFVSCVIVFAPDGCIIARVLNCPGTWNDVKEATWKNCGNYLMLNCLTTYGSQEIQARSAAGKGAALGLEYSKNNPRFVMDPPNRLSSMSQAPPQQNLSPAKRTFPSISNMDLNDMKRELVFRKWPHPSRGREDIIIALAQARQADPTFDLPSTLMPSEKRGKKRTK